MKGRSPAGSRKLSQKVASSAEGMTGVTNAITATEPEQELSLKGYPADRSYSTEVPARIRMKRM
jgi:hypothetical protein